MESLLKDLRYGVRMLLKRPKFTAAAALALTLGIGANSAIFSVVNAVLLRPLPFKDPDRLMMVLSTRPQDAKIMGGVSYPDYVDWRDQSQVFELISTFYSGSFKMTGTGEPEGLEGLDVSADFFRLLGVEPILGRSFLPEEDVPGVGDGVILSYGFWQRRFHGDPSIIGQALTLEGGRRTVIGVLPQDFRFPLAEKAELWGLLTYDAFNLKQRGNRSLFVIARLKPGISQKTAQAEMDTIAARLEQQFPATNTGRIVVLTPLLDHIVENIRPALLLLLGMVGFVLLIACSNVAHLALVGTAARQKEIAIRAALGASRFRVVRQLMTESLLLAIVGGAMGLALTHSGIKLLVAISPDNIPRLQTVEVDGRVLGFTLVVSLLTGIIFGLAPALMASKPDLNESLKEGGGISGGGRSRLRLRNLLMVSETALVLVLLVGAGLLIRSFLRLQRVDPGFDPKNVLTVSITLPHLKFDQASPFFREVIERIEALPGVESVGAVTQLPLGASDDTSPYKTLRTTLRILDRPAPPKGEEPRAELRGTTTGYFRTMRIPLVRGREFTDNDVEGRPGVIIINEALARREWPDEDPIGRKLSIGLRLYKNEPTEREIVGVVGNVRHFSLSAEPVPEMYVPHRQQHWPFLALVMRTSSDPMALTGPVRDEVWAVDKDQPVDHIQSMEGLLSRQVAPPRFYLMMLSIFAALALVLAALGIYGVISYSVSQRTHEIGIRMAMGAQKRDVIKLVVRQGMILALIGVLIGSAGAFALTRVMSSLLYEVSPTDLATFVVTPLLLSGVALLASYIPAHRAAKVDPQVALRYE